MNANSRMSRQGANGWVNRLGEMLQQRTGAAQTLRRLENEKLPDTATGFVWWTSGDSSLTVGASFTDAGLLAGRPEPGSFDDAAAALAALLNQVWEGRRGEIAAGAPPREGLEIWEVSISPTEAVRLLVLDRNTMSDTSSNLGALLDIELPITLRFGSTHMALQDILALNTGSVVEFDGALEDPVEVLVNGHVVARGEAITVGGAYGVKISEIISRQERVMAPAGV